MRHRILVLFPLALLAAGEPLSACTAFCASNGRVVLVGNNEDYNNPFTRIWFVPAAKGTFGRLYVGFDNLWPQGGMNERGLWFDGFATPPVEATHSAQKPRYTGNLLDKAMAECATVEDVVRLFDRYSRAWIERAVLMFADASGDSVIIEPDAFLHKKGKFQVQTNFHQSRAKPGEYPCERFKIATAMLEQAGDSISVELCRRVLAATHQEGNYPTLYSNIYDLKRRVMYLYHFHNFENAVTLDLAQELKKGSHVLEIPALFPKTFAAEVFLRNRATEMQRAGRRPVKVDPKIYDDYAGTYRLATGPTFTVTRDGERLLVEAEGLGKVEMYPESESRYFLKSAGAQVTFLRGAGGKVNEVVVRQDGRDIPGKRATSSQ